MPVTLSDHEIGVLLAEPKPLPADYRSRTKLRPKMGHMERELDLAGSSGSEFRLILRQSELNPLDFSVILAYRPPGTSQAFRLRRYNGKSHQHTNSLEEQTLYDFHIHTATERYQASGLREDSYAQPTNRYADIHGAIQCMVADCGFSLPPGDQLDLL